MISPLLAIAALFVLGIAAGFHLARWAQIARGGSAAEGKQGVPGDAPIGQLFASGQHAQSVVCPDGEADSDIPAEQARVDKLTDLPNRRAFEEDLCRRLAEWRRKNTPLSVMLIDIDRFRRINEDFGRQWGDTVLRGVCRIVTAALRDMDFLARYRGDQLAVILPATSGEEAAAPAKRIRAEVADALFRIEGMETRLTVSIGATEALEGDFEPLLLERADAALAEAKRSGGNCVHFHNGRASKALPAFEPDGLLIARPMATARRTVEGG